jgi:hypothetical protein
VFIADLIVSILFAALLVVSATGKIRHDKAQLATLEKVGATRLIPLLATAELAAAAGLAVGLAWWPLAVAAGAGVVLYFLGAIGSHLRVGDRAGILPPVVLLLVAVATLVLRLLSA